jgi:SAM-dependent methyltransferase
MQQRHAWESGFERELTWWRGYLETKGGSAPDDFQFRFDPDTELQPHIANQLSPSSDGGPIAILDCAAGPATTLGKMYADHYRQMFDKLGFAPPVPTIYAEIERLDEQFESASFDLTYMRFALDHCLDPRAALRQMIRVTRPTGVVMIEHYRDEDEVVYQGLRQWDLRPEPGDLVIANNTDRFRLSDVLPAGARFSVDFSPTWLTVLIWPS